MINSVKKILREIEILKDKKLIKSVEIIGVKSSVIKARLQISSNLFVQVYRNDKYGTTNFSLILNQQRIYGKDEIEGKWHRHSADNPEIHDFSKEGSKSINLLQFWEEVEEVLKKKKLL